MSTLRRRIIGDSAPLHTTLTIQQGKTTTKNTVIVDGRDAIDWIRANSHCYLSKYIDGVVNLCQLNDLDGTKFFDGSDATTDRATVGIDSFMKLPDFWYRCDTYGMDVDPAYDTSVDEAKTGTNQIIIDIVNKPLPGYQKWNGNLLFGCHEAYVANNKVYSVSGVASTASTSQSNFKTRARARGAGFHCITWEQHCIMALLYYAYYGNVDSQAQCGSGTNDYTKNTGLRNSLGMRDTDSTNGNTSSIVFWGLDNWWGNKQEWIDNVRFNVSGIDYIYHIDGPITEIELRSFRSYVNVNALGNCVSMYWGKNLDLAQASVTNNDGNYNTGYCDALRSYREIASRVVCRSGSKSGPACGVGISSVYYDSSTTNPDYGSRLAFSGEHRIVSSVSDWQSL